MIPSVRNTTAVASAVAPAMRLKLGFDNYAVRACGWKSRELLAYAVAQRVDVLLLSDLDVYERRDETFLRELRQRAADQGIALFAGTLSICPGSILFAPHRGSAEEQLRETIRVARAIGSPVARCVLGNVEDRRSPGGIEARLAETVRVLRSARSLASDSGIKIAVENHAGDLQARELAGLIVEAGCDFVGATLDTGNAWWALEEPLAALEILGPLAVCTGVRDAAVWETPEGVCLQWTALGEGVVDWPVFFRRYAELCPHVPVILETISGRPIPLPLRREDFRAAYPRSTPEDFDRLGQIARSGTPRLPFAPGAITEADYQRAELERSLAHARELFATKKKPAIAGGL